MPPCIILRAWVCFFEGFAEAFCANVGVNLGCADAFVPQHFLDAHDFGSVFQKVGGETVSQYVRAGLAFPSDVTEQIVNVLA